MTLKRPFGQTLHLLQRLACATLALGTLTLAHGQDKTALERSRTAFNNAEVVYLTLLGEIEVQLGEPGAGYSLLLNAGRKSGDGELFKRAIQLALKARSGESAVDAAKAWGTSQPSDPEPLRVLVQVLLSLQRVEETGPHLSKLLELTPDNERVALIDAIGQIYSQSRDPQIALKVVAPRLRTWRDTPATAGAAQAALARVQLAAGQDVQAADTLKQALTAPVPSTLAGVLAVDWLGGAAPVSEQWVVSLLQQHPELSPVRLAYARHLLRTERWDEAERQLDQLTSGPQADQSPPESWLMLGALQLQSRKLDAAQRSFQRFLAAPDVATTDTFARGRNQAYLSLSQIAEEQHHLDEAQQWLDKIEDNEDPLRVQSRRAGLLVRSGQWQQAVELIRSVADNPDDGNRARLLAEVQVLRDAGQLQAAYDRLAQAVALMPGDQDLLYEQATVAERLGRHDDMERQLREVIRLKPDHHHALNFLGYSLADRNERLPEAKALIVQALALAPGDPFITDSLGWVEYRMGNLDQALKNLTIAYAARPDAEIAVHLGEVLWVLGQHPAAMEHFRRAQAMQPDNDLLKQTVQRLKVPW